MWVVESRELRHLGTRGRGHAEEVAVNISPRLEHRIRRRFLPQSGYILFVLYAVLLSVSPSSGRGKVDPGEVLWLSSPAPTSQDSQDSPRAPCSTTMMPANANRLLTCLRGSSASCSHSNVLELHPSPAVTFVAIRRVPQSFTALAARCEGVAFVQAVRDDVI
ncbi:hypothetical protein BU26DRAFT_525727 [Trematosphaeria pertusa]|uniref:Uncharacterized protein n=1 Tax=Trematosphaeria pertusa TaxID=390896 RepID=A0A6A6HSP7_9PLEO|nr:uncharacterized protein BU26DRAFT_525727 [Trematosphaeria pertusa]KAF2240822.1 hypothetical protein BU26DRAFT_525727 [Trematosphaeria pertusa]